MKAIVGVVIVLGLGLAGCMPGSGKSWTMAQARTYTDYDKDCPSKKKWLECDGYRTPSEANGGSGGDE